MATAWTHGLFDCCGSTPDGTGGPLLCLRATCCPCTVIGDINASIGGPGDFVGGCCGWLCLAVCAGWPAVCCQAWQAMKASRMAGLGEEGCLKACCCSLCCGCCYSIQVYKELRYKNITPPDQQEMK
eukprot:TRINITY_DN2852_c0_g1_i3.p2 TRINITY_DN2852_c0_g1~~TRINITY_DN2852_c0_g1_i3.p2  ORF type:complete len:145 (-),score=29.37 TRINITY_DN2852_c0_g1_i3:57-437(-)